jgi:hypothetical protein
VSPAGVEVALAERERFLDAQPAPPQHDDQRAEPEAVAVVAGMAHHGDDLLDSRRVGGIELPLVARRTSGVVAGHGRERATPTGGIEHCWDDHGISSQSHSVRSPLPYQQSRISRTPSPLQIALSLPDGDAELGALGNDTPVARPLQEPWRVTASLSLSAASASRSATAWTAS